MGKGDIKTKRGKIWNGSYGKKRLRKKNKFNQASKQTSSKVENAG